MKNKLIALALLALAALTLGNITVSTVYVNYFDPEMVALQQRFVAEGATNCSYGYSADNGAYLGTCTGGILADRDTLTVRKNFFGVGRWERDSSGIIWDYSTFRFYYYKFWVW